MRCLGSSGTGVVTVFRDVFQNKTLSLYYVLALRTILCVSIFREECSTKHQSRYRRYAIEGSLPLCRITRS